MKVTRRGLGKNNLNALLADALGSGFKLQKKSFSEPTPAELTPSLEPNHELPDSTLISESVDLAPESAPLLAAEVSESNEYQQLSIDCLQPGKYQPRRDIQDSDLESLAASIRTQGILQPLIVRAVSENRYEIVAGERRWRAAQRVGLTTVPVLVKEMPDQVAIAIALIENIQRENLNALEEAIALDRLSREFDLTHEKLAETIGKSRAHVSNLLRLLNLNADVKILLERGDLEMGHAKALLSLTGTQQSQVARHVVSKQLSVRETEAFVQKTISQKNHAESATSEKHTDPADPNIQALQEKLAGRLNAVVLIQHSYKTHKGKLIVQYNSLDELEGILSHIQ